MFTYTAWDSLRVMAQQFDAHLVSAPHEPTALAPRGRRPVAGGTVRGMVRRLQARLANFQVTSSRRA